MIENVIKSLELMGKGMAAIFLVILVIYGFVSLLLKMDSNARKPS